MATKKTATKTTPKKAAAPKKAASGAKTAKTKASVADFLAAVSDEEVRRDCKTLVTMLRRITGHPAAMWGASLVGFGQYHFVYASGREGDWPLVAFSPRKKTLSVYVMPGFDPYGKQLALLGPHKLGKACLYLDGLAEVDLAVLEEILSDAVTRMREKA